MTDELIPAESISRRDMLKRSAVVGGASAMVWAAPSLTTFSARALGSTGTELTGWSFVAFIVECGGVRYRAKWNRETGFEDGAGLPSCQELPFYAAYQDALQNGPFTVSAPKQNNNILTFTITGEGCTIVKFEGSDGAEGGVGVAKQATECEPAGTVSADGKTIQFDVSIFD